MPLSRRLFSLLVLLAALLGRDVAAQDHARLVADEASRTPIGPRHAAGAIVWNHGGEAPLQADPTPAVFIELLRAQRFDVFRLERRPDGDTIQASTAALVAAARTVRARGYRHVVLAGHSAGGWIALTSAAAVPALADSVIALVPAAYGRVAVNPSRAQRNRDDLLQIVDAIERTRVMVFLFDGDAFDPGDRGSALATLLRQRGLVHLVVDKPAGLRGHGVGLTRAFARRFGPCIVDFVVATAQAPLACDRFTAAEIPFEFPDLAPRFASGAANDNDPALAPLLGAWRGSLENGDDVQLVIEGGPRQRVRAVFARGRSLAGAKDRGFSLAQLGSYDPERGVVVFEGRGRFRVVARPQARDSLAVTVGNPDNGPGINGALDRVSWAPAVAAGPTLSP